MGVGKHCPNRQLEKVQALPLRVLSQDLLHEGSDVSLLGFVRGEERVLHQLQVAHAFRGVLSQALCSKVHKLRGETVSWELGGRLLYHLLQLLEGGPPGLVRKSQNGHLDHGDAEAPDIGLDIVAFLVQFWVDSLRGHVGFAASIHCLGHGIHQVTTDPKVTHLHVALLVDKDIGRLHISVDHGQLAVQVFQGPHDLVCGIGSGEKQVASTVTEP